MAYYARSSSSISGEHLGRSSYPSSFCSLMWNSQYLMLIFCFLQSLQSNLTLIKAVFNTGLKFKNSYISSKCRS